MATILFIDDADLMRTVFQVALEKAGYRVLTAESGPHGLRLLQHQEVDLILVDILCLAWTAWKSSNFFI